MPSTHKGQLSPLKCAFKPFRDGLALALGCDDSLFDQQPIRWAAAAKPGKVVVEIGGGDG
jgi:hypothetical protein